jgi:peroxiredoxin
MLESRAIWRVGFAGVLLLLIGSTVVLARQNRRLVRDNGELFERATRPYAGMVVPIVPAVSLQGDTVSLGAPALSERQVLFFFTTTCPFCRSAMPVWRSLARQATANSRARVYGVALDSADTLAAYVANAGLEFPVVRRSDPRFLHVYRSKAVPLTMVVNDSGRVLYARFGVLDSLTHFDSLLAILAMPDTLRGDVALGVSSKSVGSDSQPGGVP